MERQIKQVLAFQLAVGNEVPLKAKLIPNEQAMLRLNLQMEELNEMREAIAKGDIVEIADAIIDQMYLLIGTAIDYGLAERMRPLFDEVHRSNMSKLNEEGKFTFNEKGKVVKPDHYSKPNLKAILERGAEELSDIEEELILASRKLKQDFENKINKFIGKNLKPKDQAKFKDYQNLEKQLSKIIDVSIDDAMGLSVAKVKLYNETPFTVWE